MKVLALLALIAAAPLAGCGDTDDDGSSLQELNVNSRYTVESVHVLGLRKVNISRRLRTALDQVVGSKYDDSRVRRLADRIKNELRASEVMVNVTRGADPEHLIVNFDVKNLEQPFDLNLAKFLYDSKEGWTGDGSATTNFKGNAFMFGLVSDADSLIERFSGIRVKFERKHAGTDRLGLRFEFDSFHEQWNAATLNAASPSDIYSSRQVYTPEATLDIASPLELSFGASFARFRIPYSNGDAAAAKTESSNAVVSTLRYHRRWGSENDHHDQELSGAYSIQASTNLLEADEVYTRHLVNARYRVRRAHSVVEIGFLAGLLNGHAPLFERFVLGDSTTLRGWNKFDLDPLGGSRVMHGSIDYGYKYFQVFYDAGAIWDNVQDREPKQSIGTGVKVEGFQVAVAFPIRAGHIEPVLYAGLNF